MQSTENNESNGETMPSAGSSSNSVSESSYDFTLLDPKEVAFSQEYIRNGFKHRDAAELCGHAAKHGIRILNRPLVRAYINHLQEEDAFLSIITKRVYESRLLELNDMAMGELPIPMVDKEGNEFEARVFNGPLALSTLQELGKTNKIIKDEGKGGGSVNVNIDVSKLIGAAPVTEGVTIDVEVDD